ncbi:MAG: delta-60 repeat domain-containing protein [Desulfobulbus sp.]|jgi:uncharacterized delta-60 repeat protein
MTRYVRYLLLRYLLLLLALWAGGAEPARSAARLDPGFGFDGRVAVEPGLRNNGHAVLVQPDGKVVLAGATSDRGGALAFVLLRFNQDGSLDESFNGTGSVITPLVAGDNGALVLGRLSDGRIVAGGYGFNGRDRDFALACYRSDGVLDENFGVAGAVLTSIGSGNEEITGLSVNAADQITVVGSSEGTVGRALVAARYTAAGRLDPDFGDQGVTLIGMGTDARAEGVLERSDGSLVVSGSFEENGHSRAMLLGLRSDGSMNPDFGDQGVVRVAGDVPDSEGYGAAIDSEDRIYLAGAVGTLGNRDAALFRCAANGAPDSSFGRNGVLVVRASEEDDLFYDVAIGSSGVAATGFTTGDKRRLVLFASYPPVGRGVRSAPAGGPSSEDWPESGPEPEIGPVQNVWLNGGTRLQMRRLQEWSNEIVVHSLQLSGNPFPWFFQEETPVLPPSAYEEALVLAGTPEVSLPSAPAEIVIPAAGSEGQALTTVAFSEGEAVSYGIALDQDGHFVVVGTAEGSRSSFMVAARLVPEELLDRVVDRPGFRSGAITTLPATGVTRSSLTTGGSIAAGFPGGVIRRGVVFARTPAPIWSGADSSSGRTSGTGERDAAAPLLDSGATDNGSGPGEFSAVLHRLYPGTLYYLRAYAVTANNEVYYGDQRSVRTADACFVAGAAFGGLTHPGVQVLREFRDGYLLPSGPGRALVDAYYQTAPPLAELIKHYPALQALVRGILLPVIACCWLVLHGWAGPVLAGGVLSAGLWLYRRPPRGWKVRV